MTKKQYLSAAFVALVVGCGGSQSEEPSEAVLCEDYCVVSCNKYVVCDPYEYTSESELNECVDACAEASERSVIANGTTEELAQENCDAARETVVEMSCEEFMEFIAGEA